VQPCARDGHPCCRDVNPFWRHSVAFFLVGRYDLSIDCLGPSGRGVSLTGRFRRRGLHCRLMIWAAVVVQLHLLVVQDLHHHAPSPPAANPRQASVLTPDAGPQIRAALVQGPSSPLCAACQITRHGSVRIGPSNLTPFQSVKSGAIVPRPAPAFHHVPRFPLTGRDPPLFS
jgi:hypothetical protein